MKFYELDKRNKTCLAKRNYPYDFPVGNETYVLRAGIIRSRLRDLLFSRLTMADLEETVKEDFKALDYPSEKQREEHERRAAFLIARAYLSETRRRYPTKTLTVDIGDGEPGEVSPDAVFYEGGDSITVTRYEAKKADMSLKASKNSLRLYALLKYGRQLVAPGKTVHLTAEIIYLRREDDKSGEDIAPYAAGSKKLTDKGGKNVFRLTETYTAPLSGGEAETETDRRYAEAVKAYSAGTLQEDCTQSDCAACDMQPLCSWADPPMQAAKAAVTRKASAIMLTPEQRTAKEYERGIVVINAGAGAGKTTVVAMRVVALLNKGVKPEEILMISFTNAAAQEMRARIDFLAEDDGIADEVDISKIYTVTFNAFGDSIALDNHKALGYPEPPHLIDDVERFGIVAEMISANIIDGLDYKNFDSNERFVKGAVATAAKAFELFKKHPTLGYGDLDELYDLFSEYHAFCPKDSFEKLYRLFPEYDRRLRDNCLLEFVDQENLIFEVLTDNPYYFEKYGFRHVIVDEFQDTNERQMEIIKKLTVCPSFESLMVVGDDSQAIYSFRDTSPEFIINFQKIMGCKVDDIRLLENHRSTPQIIDFANKINELNTNRVIKDLVATRPDGEPVTVKGFLTAEEEQEYVVAEIGKRISTGTRPEDIAVMARNKSELGKLADMLAKAGIPAVVQYPEKLLEDSRVYAALSMLKAIKDPGAKYLIYYANGLEAGALKTADEAAVKAACDKALEKINAYKAIPDEPGKKEFLTGMLAELDPDKTDQLYTAFVEKLMLRPTTDKIFKYAAQFERFGKTVAVKRTGNYPGVVLSTAHSSKGLEWPVCFNMIGGYDKKELHTSGGASTLARVEEERRLLFVSSTRARDKLYITSKYTCGGSAGNYVYNRYLGESFHAIGESYSTEKVEAERLARKKAEAEKAKAEKPKANATPSEEAEKPGA